MIHLKPVLLTVAFILILAISISSFIERTQSNGRIMEASSVSLPPADASYVKTFQIQNNSAEASPWLLYPASNKTVWVVAIKLGKPLFSQIINFTMTGPNTGAAVLAANLTNTVPNDIVYDQSSNRVWIVENDSLAYYNQTADSKITIARTFPNGSPFYLAIDPSDNLWLTLLGTDQIVEYNPTSGTGYNYSTPSSNVGLQGIAVSPVDHSIWFAEAYNGKIGQIVPCKTPPSCPIVEYTPPPGISLNGVIQVAVDNSGIVWFTVHDGNEFGSFSPSTGHWMLFPIGYCPDSYVQGCETGLPNAIDVDTKGQVWFSEHIAGRMARYDPINGTLIEYTLPNSSPVCKNSCAPYSWWMWPGQDSLVWFVSFGLGQIGYVNSTVPVPFAVDTQPNLIINQGYSGKIVASSEFLGTPPSFNVSATSQDSLADPAMLSWSLTKEQISHQNNIVTATVTISASWSSTVGPRYIAITAFNQNVTVNTFVRVDIVTSPIAFTTIGLAGGVSTLAVASLGMSMYSKKRRQALVQGEGSGLD